MMLIRKLASPMCSPELPITQSPILPRYSHGIGRTHGTSCHTPPRPLNPRRSPDGYLETLLNAAAHAADPGIHIIHEAKKFAAQGPNDEDLDRARAMLQDIDTYWMQPLAAQMSY